MSAAATYAAAAPAEAPSRAQALERLLERMQAGSDFPALSSRVSMVQRLASSDDAPLQRVADEILQDVGLTQKLLRLVNSAFFRRHGHSVATITRAVALVGLAGIRNLALSLVLVEHMQDRAHAQRLKQTFARALLAGQLAHDLARTPQEAEAAFLGALFSRLGLLVTEVYFPDEAGQVRARIAQGAPAADDAKAEALAERMSAEVLGVGFEDLGVAVANGWGLPEGLLQAMRHPHGSSPGRRLGPGTEYLRWLSVASHEAAAALWHADPSQLPWRLDRVVHRHGRALGLGHAELRRAADSARRTLVEMSATLGLALPGHVATAAASAATVAADRASVDGPGEGGPPAVTPADASPALAPPGSASGLHATLSLLSAGVQDVAATLASERAPLQPALTIALEAIYRALACRRVVLFLHDVPAARLVGRLGLGAGVADQCAQMQAGLQPAAGRPLDALARAALAGDALWVPRLADHPGPWPAWWSAVPGQAGSPAAGTAPAALLALPLRLRDRLLGVVYADFDQPGHWPDAERALLRTLCSQLVLAFRPTA